MIKQYSIQIAMATMFICEYLKTTHTGWLVFSIIGFGIMTLINYYAEISDSQLSSSKSKKEVNKQ